MSVYNFPSFKQTRDYDCGTQVLRNTLIYYGIKTSERKIMKISGLTEDGTTISGMERVLKKFKLKFVSRKMTLAELKNYLDRRIPVILLFQDRRYHKKDKWAEVWEHGHFAVAIGYNREYLFLQDPDIKNFATLRINEVKARWHASEVDDVEKKYYQRGIAALGPENGAYWKKSGDLDLRRNWVKRKRNSA